MTYEDQQHLEKASFGFWVYLMTDLILFATLFATYAVLRNNVYGGPNGAAIFDLPLVLVETMLLLTSSFTSGLMLLAAHHKKKATTIVWLLVTFLLGAAFLCIEIYEFTHLIHEGNGPGRSAFLSAFFTLIGTHGLHIAVGLLWLLVLVWQVARRSFSVHTIRKLTLFSLFWHFLDIVWIFIFTIVYLMGAA